MLRVCRKTSGVTKPDPVSSESWNIPWYGRFRDRDCSMHDVARKEKGDTTLLCYVERETRAFLEQRLKM